MINKKCVIEICGGIASGKSTLAGLLSAHGFNVLKEEYSKNPYINSFYINQKVNAFETEISFLLQHYHQIKNAKEGKCKIVCDFSFVLDRAYAEVTLSQKKRRIFLIILREILEEIKLPELLIYLRCPKEVQLMRINKRKRKVEKTISLAYLNALNEAIEERIKAWPPNKRLLIIDSNAINYASNRSDKSFVLSSVFDGLKKIRKN